MAGGDRLPDPASDGDLDERRGVSLYLTTSGRRAAPEFPDDLGPWPELAAVENARRLEREYQEMISAQSAAEAALQTAKRQNCQAVREGH